MYFKKIKGRGTQTQQPCWAEVTRSRGAVTLPTSFVLLHVPVLTAVDVTVGVLLLVGAMSGVGSRRCELDTPAVNKNVTFVSVGKTSTITRNDSFHRATRAHDILLYWSSSNIIDQEFEPPAIFLTFSKNYFGNIA